MDTITYTNITQAPGTSVAQLIDFEVSNEIEANLTLFWHILGISEDIFGTFSAGSLTVLVQSFPESEMAETKLCPSLRTVGISHFG